MTEREKVEFRRLQDRAWSIFYQALCRGSIVKPTYCQHCGRESKLEAHHYDYNKPLEVQWLCKRCHSKAHKGRIKGQYTVLESYFTG